MGSWKARNNHMPVAADKGTRVWSSGHAIFIQGHDMTEPQAHPKQKKRGSWVPMVSRWMVGGGIFRTDWARMAWGQSQITFSGRSEKCFGSPLDLLLVHPGSMGPLCNFGTFGPYVVMRLFTKHKHSSFTSPTESSDINA